MQDNLFVKEKGQVKLEYKTENDAVGQEDRNCGQNCIRVSIFCALSCSMRKARLEFEDRKDNDNMEMDL
jgi:hypothetical protein